MHTIRVTSHLYTTADGISTRSTAEQIWHSFPRLQWEAEDDTKEEGTLDTYVDTTLGIAFQLRRDADRRAQPCYSIEVFPAHTDGPAWIGYMTADD